MGPDEMDHFGAPFPGESILSVISQTSYPQPENSIIISFAADMMKVALSKAKLANTALSI